MHEVTGNRLPLIRDRCKTVAQTDSLVGGICVISLGLGNAYRTATLWGIQKLVLETLQASGFRV